MTAASPIPDRNPGAHTRLELPEVADVLAVERLCQAARFAAQRGNSVSIHGQATSWLDLGALQLLHELVDELPACRLNCGVSQKSRLLRGWLVLVGTHLRFDVPIGSVSF